MGDVGQEVGTVAVLRRYPVKSMLGESRRSLGFDRRGAAGDRLYAVRDGAGKLGSGKTTRRFGRMDGLFRFRASYGDEADGPVAAPLISFPDGREIRGDDPAVHALLSERLGSAVTLSREAEVPHFDQGPVHLLTTASLRALEGALEGEFASGTIDERRFRPNLVVDAPGDDFEEDGWLGRELTVGDGTRLRVVGRTERCAMVGFAWEELRAEPALLKGVGRANEVCIGVYAEVIEPGTVRLGDRVGLA